MKELKTNGVYRFSVSDGGGKQELLISIKKEYQGKPLYLKALLRQFDKNREVEHPYLLRYVEMRDVDGLGKCIVIDWEDAMTFPEFISSNPTMEEKKSVLEQLASALGCLHERKAAHGDLSPSVVFVTTKDQQVRLLNFQQQYAGNQDDSQLVIRYQAPEIKDGTVAVTPRADMYALGMLMKDLHLSGEYYDVVSRCCHYNSSARFATMAEFTDALEHRRAPRKSGGGSVSMPKVTKGFVRGVAIVLGLAIVAAVVFYFVNDASLFAPGDSPKQAAKPDTTVSVAAQNPVVQDTVSAVAPGDYTGELAFLADLVPQMYKDIDAIYASYGATATDAEKREVRSKVKRYYLGLRKTLGKKSQAQFEAFDKAFGDYVKIKNNALN